MVERTAPDENLGIVRRALEAFNAAGADVSTAGIPPPGIYVDEPELVPLRGALEGTVFTGPTSWKQFWDASRESWTMLRLEIERMEAIGSGVLAVGKLSGTSLGTGAEVEARIAFAAHIRDGLIARNAVHLSEADARRELGGE
jgi:ketosteroid isomerase-like protein